MSRVYLTSSDTVNIGNVLDRKNEAKINELPHSFIYHGIRFVIVGARIRCTLPMNPLGKTL